VKTFRFSVVTTSCALSTASSTSSQILDTQELAFSFPLSIKYGLLEIGIVISLAEVTGEAALVASVLGTTGATGAAGVAGRPFPITRIVLFPRLDSASFFFDLIFAYMS